MWSMSLWKYKYFVDVVETKSFTKAGKKNFVSQTAISQQISALEKNIGGKLIERGNGEITVTELGQIVYERSKEMLDINDKLTQDVSQYKEQYVLRIGIDSSINKFLWKKMQELIDRYYSEEEFHFSKIDRTEGVRMLEKKELDFYIGYSIERNDRSDEISEMTISSNPAGVYLGEHSSLTVKQNISLSSLKGYKRYATCKYPCSMLADDEAEFLNFCGSVKYVDNIDTMKLKVDFNDGYAFADSYYFSHCDGQVRILEDYAPVCRIKVFYRKDKHRRKMNEVLKRIGEIMAEKQAHDF
jgi:DNA-binding transcriptional LysR family regulator